MPWWLGLYGAFPSQVGDWFSSVVFDEDYGQHGQSGQRNFHRPAAEVQPLWLPPLHRATSKTSQKSHFANLFFPRSLHPLLTPSPLRAGRIQPTRRQPLQAGAARAQRVP